MTPPRSVLFLGVANAARSIMAERILAEAGRKRFRAYSAGSHPSGRLDENALAVLGARGHASDGLRSKTWDEFAGEDAPALDVVITLANELIGEVCPVFWTGRPVTSHWPLAGRDLDADYETLATRIAAFAALPFADLDPLGLQAKLDEIGRL